MISGHRTLNLGQLGGRLFRPDAGYSEQMQVPEKFAGNRWYIFQCRSETCRLSGNICPASVEIVPPCDGGNEYCYKYLNQRQVIVKQVPENGCVTFGNIGSFSFTKQQKEKTHLHKKDTDSASRCQDFSIGARQPSDPSVPEKNAHPELFSSLPSGTSKRHLTNKKHNHGKVSKPCRGSGNKSSKALYVQSAICESRAQQKQQQADATLAPQHKKSGIADIPEIWFATKSELRKYAQNHTVDEQSITTDIIEKVSGYNNKTIKMMWDVACVANSEARKGEFTQATIKVVNCITQALYELREPRCREYSLWICWLGWMFIQNEVSDADRKNFMLAADTTEKGKFSFLSGKNIVAAFCDRRKKLPGEFIRKNTYLHFDPEARVCENKTPLALWKLSFFDPDCRDQQLRCVWKGILQHFFTGDKCNDELKGPERVASNIMELMIDAIYSRRSGSEREWRSLLGFDSQHSDWHGRGPLSDEFNPSSDAFK